VNPIRSTPRHNLTARSLRQRPPKQANLAFQTPFLSKPRSRNSGRPTVSTTTLALTLELRPQARHDDASDQSDRRFIRFTPTLNEYRGPWTPEPPAIGALAGFWLTICLVLVHVRLLWWRPRLSVGRVTGAQPPRSLVLSGGGRFTFQRSVVSHSVCLLLRGSFLCLCNYVLHKWSSLLPTLGNAVLAFRAIAS